MILYNVLEVAGYRGIIPYRYNVSRKVAAMLASIARHFVAAGRWWEQRQFEDGNSVLLLINENYKIVMLG